MIKTELCQYTESRIWLVHGQRFVSRDGKPNLFILLKADSLSHQCIKPMNLHWTQALREFQFSNEQAFSTVCRSGSTATADASTSFVLDVIHIQGPVMIGAKFHRRGHI